jgi:hypothetical protein
MTMRGATRSKRLPRSSPASAHQIRARATVATCGVGWSSAPRNGCTHTRGAEGEGGYDYALVCLLGLNGLRVSEACSPDVGDRSPRPTFVLMTATAR